ncbi:MAG: hypothetical protein R3A13_05270 [Bdellovibrionota bacterium]
MQIITVDSEQFDELVKVVKEGKHIGTYICPKGSKSVHITNQFIVVAPENQPNKVAYKPVKNLEDAEYLALQLLRKEAARGSQVHYPEE